MWCTTAGMTRYGATSPIRRRSPSSTVRGSIKPGNLPRSASRAGLDKHHYQIGPRIGFVLLWCDRWAGSGETEVEQDKPLAAGGLPAGDREVSRLLEAGRLSDANSLLDKVVGVPLDDQQTRASTLINRAITAWRLGRIPLALELAAEGWTDLSALPQQGSMVASSISQLGYLLEGLGNHRAAVETMRTAVRLAREAGETTVLAACLQRLGGLLNFRAMDGSAQQARAIFEQARALLAEGLALDADPRMHRGLLGAYGRSLAGLGELTAAAEAGRQVLTLGTEADDLWAQAVGEW